MTNTRRLFLLALASTLFIPGCNRPSAPPAQPAQNAAPAQPSPAPAMPKLAAGECGAPNGARGFLRITSPDLTGAYERCSFDLQGKVGAVQGRQVGEKDSSIIILSLTRTGTVRCEKDSPVAVNYRAQNPASLYVAHTDKLGKCEITNTVLDAKHWAGKLSATLVPGGRDTGKNLKPIHMQVEWDISKP
jgi:hypothetical protein